VKQAEVRSPTNSDVDSPKRQAILFDIDLDRKQAHSIPQGDARMYSEASLQDECFSVKSLMPRRLNFSEPASTHALHETKTNPDANSRLVLPLTKAFICMLERSAGLL
jgi:hypothetical protein